MAPSSRTARVDGVVGGLVRVEAVEPPADAEPATGLAAVALTGDDPHRYVAGGLAAGGADARWSRPAPSPPSRRRSRHGPPGGYAGRRPGPAPREPGPSSTLAVVGTAASRSSQRSRSTGGDPVGNSQGDVLVGRGEGGVVARLGQGLLQHRRVERAGPGETQPVVGDHPDADARRGGRCQRFDFPVVGTDVGLVDPGRRRPRSPRRCAPIRPPARPAAVRSLRLGSARPSVPASSRVSATVLIRPCPRW